MKAIWEFLNGKKTWIGAGLILVGYGIDYAGVDPVIGQAIRDIGIALGGLGVLHKVFKAGVSSGEKL